MGHAHLIENGKIVGWWDDHGEPHYYCKLIPIPLPAEKSADVGLSVSLEKALKIVGLDLPDEG